MNQQCNLYVEPKSVLTNTHPVNIGLFATPMGMHYKKHWKKKLRITHTVTHCFLAIDAYPHVHICRPRAIQSKNNSNNNNKILYCVFWSWSSVIFFSKFILLCMLWFDCLLLEAIGGSGGGGGSIYCREWMWRKIN